MNFLLSALSAQPFEHLFKLTDSELTTLNIQKSVVDKASDVPCRISLKDADIGDTVLLLNFSHQPENTPFQAAHAIFIRQNVARASLAMNEIPEMISKRVISVRAFDEKHMMLDADIAQGESLQHTIVTMLKNKTIAYLHLHFAKHGCYAAKVTRYAELSSVRS